MMIVLDCENQMMVVVTEWLMIKEVSNKMVDFVRFMNRDNYCIFYPYSSLGDLNFLFYKFF